ncbi:DUF7118 family protein [Haloarcula nitratireducens]|uniref:Uncharacterized protein n=1 Tax=Haloarcula nitratireducens TaxID=2487749 RepID=A0AAW4PEJ4_9EURY|nr:hypothetical protein [Halomicroarcula nitratireducens]MBX0296035.1 hypothetical protein [Halomicroarcula nitratireducens]
MSDAARELETAAEERRRARERVEAVGEDELRTCREAYRKLLDLLDRYEGRATGSGDFKAFTEFQGTVGTLTDELPEDLPERETFEEVDDFLQQRRLSERDFERAREQLEPVGDLVARLAEWNDARERYAEARRAARRRIGELDERIADLERLRRLGDADLDAPVENLREPVEAYDDAVREAFRAFRDDSPARDVLSAVERADAYPLVDFQSPPEELLTYVRTAEAGTEPIPKLLEYADYSASKLDHYVEDTAALKRAITTRRTYLRNLDADPLTVSWPPPPAERLPWLVREYRPVVSGFADESVVARLREVRDLAAREDYARLRESALARSELSSEERERLASGAVERELESAREERNAIEAALEEHESL